MKSFDIIQILSTEWWCLVNIVYDIYDIPAPQQDRVKLEYNIGYAGWNWEYERQDFSKNDIIFVQSVSTSKYDTKINLPATL